MGSVPLGRDQLSGERVELSAQAHERSMYLIGKSGYGKSTVLAEMITEDLAAGEAVVVLDPHGTLVDSLIPWIPEERAEDVYLLNCGDPERTFGLNLLDMGQHDQESVEEFVDVFRAVWHDNWGTWMEELLTAIGYTAREVPELKLTDVRRLLAYGRNPYREEIVGRLHDPETKAYWDEFERWTRYEWGERVRSTMVRVRSFVLNPRVRAIVGQETSIDFGAIATGEKILLVNLDVNTLKEKPVSLLGSMILNRLINELRKRNRDKPVIHVYGDEVQLFTSPLFSTGFHQMRKFGLAPIAANQVLVDLPERQRKALLSANTLAAFALEGEDARIVAGQFKAKAERPTPLMASDPWGELRKGGHPHNPAITEQYLQLLELMTEHASIYERYLDTVPWHRHEVPRLMQTVNQRLEQAIRAYFMLARQRPKLWDWLLIYDVDEAGYWRIKQSQIFYPHGEWWDRMLDWGKRWRVVIEQLAASLREHPIQAPEWVAAQLTAPKKGTPEVITDHANELATLNWYQAWVRIGGSPSQEYRIETLPPVAPPDNPQLEARLRSCYQDYTRLRSDVLAEIAAREVPVATVTKKSSVGVSKVEPPRTGLGVPADVLEERARPSIIKRRPIT